jgi:hypothetical protein
MESATTWAFVHLRPLDAGIALPKGLALFTIALAFVRQTI